MKSSLKNVVHKFRIGVVLFGILVSIATSLTGDYSGGSGVGQLLWFVGIALWTFFPYAVYGAVSSEIKNSGAKVGGGLSVLLVDVYVRVKLFFSPGSSTAGLAVLFMPFWLSVIILPLGLAVGWFVGRPTANKIKEEKYNHRDRTL